MTSRLAIAIIAALGLLGTLAACVGCDDAGETARAQASTTNASALETATEDVAAVANVSSNDQAAAPPTAEESSIVARAESARPRRPQGVADITFDDVKFPMEKNDEFKRTLITPNIEALHGNRVRIRGYILPSFQQSGLTQFVLVRDNLECCFGPGAMLYDCIIVEMLPGKSTDFTVRPVAVEGMFEIEEYLDFDGVVRAIYHLDGEAVSL